MTGLHQVMYQYVGLWVYLLPILVMGFWLVLIYIKREPHIDSIREFVNLLNTRGGNILILAAMSTGFFVAAMKLFYAMIDLAVSGKLSTDNAFPMMALQFVTSSAFGGAFGAMLTMMTGSDGKGRVGDKVLNGTVPNGVPSPDAPLADKPTPPEPAPILSAPKV